VLEFAFIHLRQSLSNYRNVAGKASSKNLPLPFLRGEGTVKEETAKLPGAGITPKLCPMERVGIRGDGPNGAWRFSETYRTYRNQVGTT
jgi:hypothetical protein